MTNTHGRRHSSHEPVGARAGAGLVTVLLMTAVIVGSAWVYARRLIADNEAQRTLAEISTVLPAGTYDNEPQLDSVLLDTGGGIPLPVWRARLAGNPAAAVLTVVAPDGYNGPIRLLVGIAADGRVLGVHVQSHMETPGIGAAVADAASGWLTQFSGRSLTDPAEERWTVRTGGSGTSDGAYDAIAGATTSSRAVVGGVRQALQYFSTNRDVIFAPGDRPEP